MPNLVGGSADLSGSNNTKTSNSNILNSKNYGGNYIHFGVREHGMAAAMNGMRYIIILFLMAVRF